MQKLQLDLDLLLPDIQKGDECLHLLTDRLHRVKGIDEAHVVRDKRLGSALPAFRSQSGLAAAREKSGDQQLAQRSRIATATSKSPSPASTPPTAPTASRAALNELPGMLHASVSYAAGLLFVAYDSEALDRGADRTDGALAGRALCRAGAQPGKGDGACAHACQLVKRKPPLRTGAVTEGRDGRARR